MKKAYWLLLPLLALASCQGLLGSSSSEETASSSDASSSSSSATASSSKEEAASSSTEEESISSSSSSEETPQKALQIADIKNILVYYGLLDGSAPFEPVAPEVKDQDGNVVPLEDVTFSFEGDDIRYENGGFIGLRGGTSTTVTATSKDGATGTFTVSVYNREYREKHEAAATSEGWYGDIEIDPVASLEEGFASGIDISSSLSIYESCGRYYGAFYNENGEEQSLYQILADNGVNWIRLRLWVDPYNHNLLDEDGNPTPYGGGICDYEHVEWMAHEAKMAGLSVLLDFHYSDFYTDPGNQVIPKAWANITSAEEMGNKIYEYTNSTLLSLKEADALPDAVALGNETTTGMLTQLPGTDGNSLTGDNPGYITGKRSAPSSIAGSAYSDNFRLYIRKANEAVKDVSAAILTMVHMARGLTATDNIIGYFNDLAGINFDIIGLSGYVYYQWQNPTTLRNALNTISAAFPTKKIAVAEHSYGFTYESDTQGNFTFSDWPDATATAVSSFEVSIQGQADCIRALTEAVANLDNGWGAFYWEGAWRIRTGCGWADSASKNSWANQGLFSYDGKALGSLEVYSLMWGN